MMPQPCPTPRSHLIADIDAANRMLNSAAFHEPDNYKLHRLLNEQLRNLQHKAVVAFAVDNDMKLSKTAFGISKLGSFGPDYHSRGSTKIFDHCIHLRQYGQNAAIICQPYSKTLETIFDAKRLAQSMGLVCWVPPQPWCSFHFPRWTLFFVFTKPNCSIRFLPEQISWAIPDQRRRVHHWRAAA
jgi:hypothetical protein